MADESSISNTTISLLAAICMALSAFSLKWSFDANADMKVMSVQMENMTESIEKLSEKSELDKKQDASISKHWKLHNWARDEINKIHFKNNEEPVSWPDLNGANDWDR
jgi:hypothetical protein